VRGIRIRIFIPYSLISLKTKEILKKKIFLTSPHPNPLPSWSEGLREKLAHPLGLAET